MYFILFSHMFLSISRKALQRAKLRRLTTPTRKAASAYNVTTCSGHQNIEILRFSTCSGHQNIEIMRFSTCFGHQILDNRY